MFMSRGDRNLGVAFQTHPGVRPRLEVLGGSAGKESTCNMGDLGLLPGLGRSLEKGTVPTPVFWPGEFHGLYSPCGCKESDTTERLSLHSTTC